MKNRKHLDYEKQWDWYKNLDFNILYYWAGVLDGEGCLKPTKNNGTISARISLKMTCEKTVKKFSETFKGVFKKVNRSKTFKSHWKNQYVGRIHGHQAAKLADVLKNFMITKKEDAEILSKFYLKNCEECKEIFWQYNGNKFCCDNCKREYLRKKYYENKQIGKA